MLIFKSFRYEPYEKVGTIFFSLSISYEICTCVVKPLKTDQRGPNLYHMGIIFSIKNSQLLSKLKIIAEKKSVLKKIERENFPKLCKVPYFPTSFTGRTIASRIIWDSTIRFLSNFTQNSVTSCRVVGLNLVHLIITTVEWQWNMLNKKC